MQRARAARKAEAELEQEHAARTKARADFQQRTLALYQQRITSVKAKIGTNPPSSAATPLATAPSTTPAQTADPATIAAQEQVASVQEQLAKQQQVMEEMQRQLAEAKQASEAARTRARARFQAERLAEEKFQQHHPSVTVEKLPPIPVPKPEQLEKYGQLFQLLTSWLAAGGTQAFTFQDLIGSTAFGQDIPPVIQSMLGSSFQQWFSSATSPETIVPRQVAVLCCESLARLKSHWEDQAALEAKIKELGAGTYSALCGAVKRRRAEAEDKAMEAA